MAFRRAGNPPLERHPKLASRYSDAGFISDPCFETGIKGHGGEVHKVHDRGRQKLAYQMRGSREGHYYLLYFSAPADALAELWKEYHLNEDLIRFMTLRADEVKEEIEFKPLPQ